MRGQQTIQSAYTKLQQWCPDHRRYLTTNAARRRRHGDEATLATVSTQQQPIPAIVRSSLCPTGQTIDFSRGWAWQQLLLSQRLALRRRPQSQSDHDHLPTNDSDLVLLLEHAPVYTLGRGADETHLQFLKQHSASNSDALQRLSRSSRGPQSARLSVDRQQLVHPTNNELLGDDNNCHITMVDSLSRLATPVMAPNGVPIYRVERGGEVTFHGPGQLVVYPMLDLSREPFCKDLKWYLNKVEQVIIEVLKEYNVEGLRDEINTGVWVDQQKVAAVGVSATKWLTTHGFALNVSTDVDYFDASIMTPCGIEGRGVTSLADLQQSRGMAPPTVVEVSALVLDKMQLVFGIELVIGETVS